MMNYFPKRPSGLLLHTLSNLYEVTVGFDPPPSYFEAVYCFICSRPKGWCCSISDDLYCSGESRSENIDVFQVYRDITIVMISS